MNRTSSEYKPVPPVLLEQSVAPTHPRAAGSAREDPKLQGNLLGEVRRAVVGWLPMGTREEGTLWGLITLPSSLGTSLGCGEQAAVEAGAHS